jgi:hypothetical protein
MKLDYEQQCYRQSEIIVRTRLGQLQKSVEEAIKPANRRNLNEGERDTYVRHAGSGNHRTRGHTVVRTASHVGYPALGGAYHRYRYFGRSYAYWQPHYYRYRYFDRSYAYWQPRHYAYHAYLLVAV